jgi:hypothetical protein
MASNLATIRVELIANAQKFKSNIDKASGGLKKLDKSTAKASAGSKKMQNRLRNLSGSIAAVQGPLGPVAGRITAIGAIMGRVSLATVAITGAFVLAGVALTKFATVGAKAESQFLKLEALLKATGGAAKVTGEDIEAMAVAIGRGTLASVQGARDAAGVLLTFKSIAGETFTRTLALTQDLAAVGFGSMKTAALQLGKALEEPEIGLSALRRVGVSFNEQQKEQIKVMSLTGRQAEAQQLILKALEEQVGGAGKGAAGGLSGAFDTLGENIVLFFEKSKVGKAIVTGLTKALTLLAEQIAKFVPDVEKLPDDIGQLNNRFKESGKTIEFLTGKYSALLDEIEELEKVTNSTNVGKARKAKKELKEIDDLINKEQERKNKIDEKIKLLEKEEKVVIKIDKTADKTSNKILRTQRRELQDLKATTRERAVNVNLRKLEDSLRSKLGEGAIAEQKINEILGERGGLIRENTIKVEDFKSQMEDIKSVANSVGQAFSKVGDTILDAFLRGKQGALDFKSILRELIIDIQKAIIKKMILDKVTGVITSGIEGILSPKSPVLGSSGKEMMAGGGTVQQGSPTIVGERGPELFVPGSAGTIKNNADSKNSMGGGVSVVQNLNFAVGVTNTVRAEVMNMLPAIQQSTITAVADAKQRGGKFSKAFGN